MLLLDLTNVLGQGNYMCDKKLQNSKYNQCTHTD